MTRQSDKIKISSLSRAAAAMLAVVFSAASGVMSGAVKDFTVAPWNLSVDTADGSVSLSRDGHKVVSGSVARWSLDSAGRSFADMRGISVKASSLDDKFGRGTVVTLSGSLGKEKAVQKIYLYPGSDYVMTDLTVSNPDGVALNHMAPVNVTRSYEVFSRPGNNIVFVPYDNDAWVRYRVDPFGQASPESYEVSAIFNTDTREGIILGSVEHDVWKTGVKTVTSGPTAIDSLSVYGGAWSTLTRDVRSHGAVKGKSVKSPRIMVGRFDDWRTGMETFADLCAVESPKIPSRGERPFGWNSWGKLQTKINHANATQTSDFIGGSLQPASFISADSTVYVGLDAFWDFGLDRQQLRDFADRCHARGQKAGIYFCPFTDWGKNPEAVVGEAPEYKYKDLYLYHNGEILTFDGAYALDPTHPAVKKRIERQVKEFVDWGYDFMKIDFMAHGAYEADSHFDPGVTTGVQAYNRGMQIIDSVADGKLWINLSIAPLFPAQYAHSRRIGCDAWADINNTEYSLNALTYGWWLDRVYHYNDADHIVMEGVTDGENRARLTSSAITGLFFLGDDLSETGNPAVKAKVLRTATNPDINEMARRCKSFRPVEHGHGDRAADMFQYTVGDTMYVAIFNYYDRSARKSLPLHRLGLSGGKEYRADELWSHDPLTLSGTMEIEVPAKDVKVLRIKLD